MGRITMAKTENLIEQLLSLILVDDLDGEARVKSARLFDSAGNLTLWTEYDDETHEIVIFATEEDNE